MLYNMHDCFMSVRSYSCHPVRHRPTVSWCIAWYVVELGLVRASATWIFFQVQFGELGLRPAGRRHRSMTQDIPWTLNVYFHHLLHLLTFDRAHFMRSLFVFIVYFSYVQLLTVQLNFASTHQF